MIFAFPVYANLGLMAVPEINTNRVAVDLSLASSNDVLLEAIVTNGADPQVLNTKIVVKYAFATSDLSLFPSRLSPVGFFDVRAPNAANGVSVTTSVPFTLRAPYLHVWLEHERFSAPCEISLNAVTQILAIGQDVIDENLVLVVDENGEQLVFA